MLSSFAALTRGTTSAASTFGCAGALLLLDENENDRPEQARRDYCPVGPDEKEISQCVE